MRHYGFVHMSREAGGDKTAPSNDKMIPPHRSRVVPCHTGFGHVGSPACTTRLNMHKDQGQTSKLAMSLMPGMRCPLASTHSSLELPVITARCTHLTQSALLKIDFGGITVISTWNIHKECSSGGAFMYLD